MLRLIIYIPDSGSCNVIGLLNGPGAIVSAATENLYE